MKKLISVLAALVLTCMTCVTAMAQPPSPGLDIIPGEGTVTTTDGEVINVNDPETMEKYVKIEKTEEVPESPEQPGYSSISVFDVIFNGITEADTTLYVPGVKEGDTVIVRMFANGKWIDVEAEVVGDNKVRVKLTQQGTLEILKASSTNGNNGNGTDKPGDNNGGTDNSGNNTNGSNGDNGTGNTQGSNTSTKSPKTGETNALPAAYAVFAGCVLAAGVAGKKARKKAQ